jgi:hypothetical protein
MKQVFLGLLLIVLGCEQSQTVGGCGELDTDTSKSSITNDGGVNDGAAELLSDGASCNENDECESAICLPSTNSFGGGYCFSTAMQGCIVVTDPSPMKALCSSVSKRLYTCGDYDVSLLGNCADIGVGDYGEHYQCCDKPGFP